MAKYKYILTVIITLCTLITYAQPAQYTPMTASGYQMKRLKVDSTLHLPSFCGVPTLRGSTAKDGALAIDTCGDYLYMWTNTGGWDTVNVSGGGGGSSTDTTSLSNRINLKVDSLKRSSDSVYAYRNGVRIFQFKDSVGGGASDTIYTQSPIMYITRNDSNIIFFNSDTANVWRNNDTSKVVIAQVHNATGTTLLRGEVVYLFGSTGNVASVKRANNKDDSTSSKTFGVVRSDILAGANGFITTQGQVEKLTLGAYNEGDVLWLDSIDGGFTKVKPQAPYHAVFIGIVERANNGNGLAYVKPQNGVELDEVHDVQINNVLNNQIIVYSDTQKVWKNRNITSLIDTTLFQRKSIQPYSFLANNTPATSNAQALPFKDTSGVYTLSPTWSGTSPTSGNLSYRWIRIGKMVTINITLIYAVAGSVTSVLTVPLPTDAPTPTKPAGLTSALNNLYPIVGSVNLTSSSTLTNSQTRGFLRNNAANNGFEFIVNFSATATAINAHITCTYFTD